MLYISNIRLITLKRSKRLLELLSDKVMSGQNQHDIWANKTDLFVDDNIGKDL